MNNCSPLVVTFMSQVTEAVMPVFYATVTAMFGYALMKFKQWVDTKVSAANQETIERAVKGGLGKVQEDSLRAELAGRPPLSREQKEERATDYVEKAVPDAIKGQDADAGKIVYARMAGKVNVAEPTPAPVVAAATPA